MSAQKPQPTGKAQAADQRDDLDLDAETVKDLDVAAKDATRLRGGLGMKTAADGPCSDVRLKDAIEPLVGSLMKLRLLRIG
jgi:hypothetical protein